MRSMFYGPRAGGGDAYDSYSYNGERLVLFDVVTTKTPAKGRRRRQQKKAMVRRG